jgi:hypothetical protein
MNFFSENNKELRELVLQLLGGRFSNAKRVNFSVSYAQNRKLSTVVIEVSPCSTVHALIFFYTRSLRLLDAINYRNRRYFRITRSGDALKRIDRINKFILSKIPKLSPIALRRIREEDDSDGSDELMKQQIQHLKDKNRIEQDVSRSLRNQIKGLRSRVRQKTGLA